MTCPYCNVCGNCEEIHGGLRDEECPWANSMDLINMGHLEYGYTLDDLDTVFLIQPNDPPESALEAMGWLEAQVEQSPQYKGRIHLTARYISKWRNIHDEVVGREF